MSRRAAGLALFALVTSGCGGSTRADPAAPAVAPPKRAATATAEAPSPAADRDLAAKGVVLQGDLPADWTQYQQGRGLIRKVRQPSRLGCSAPTGRPGSYPWVVAYDGGIFQKAKLQRFISVSAQVFADEAAARSFVATLRSPEFVACWRKERAKAVASAPGAAPGSTFRAGPVEAPSGALEAKLHFIYQARAAGRLVDANGREDMSVYRSGRLVTILAYESVASRKEPRTAAQTTDRDLKRAASLLLARVAAESL
jgi:hypothetical protein